jgi:hypothetical protein
LANRSAIFSSNVPGGPQNIVDFAKHPYDVYFIDSSNSGASDAAGYGNSPDIPLASIDYLFSLATAGKKVVGYVLPGHTETYSTTGTKMTADKAGVHIIGLGKGSNRPTITFGHVDATWVISAANITIENILFVTSVDSVVTYGTISGADFKMIDCEWRDTTDIEVITDWTITGDRPQFINCNKSGYTGGDANVRCLSFAGVDGALIKDCNFATKVTTAIIGFVTTACTNTIIDNCKFGVNGTTDYSKNVVDTIGGSTWIVTKGYDIGVGSKFSGGSGKTLSGDDVGSNSTYDSRKGIKVTRAKAAVLDGVQNAIFTIAGGRVEITHIEGEICDGAVDNESADTQFIYNPTVGATDTDMCAVGALDAAPVGTIFSITGTLADALQFGPSITPMMAKSLVLAEGTIDIKSEGDNDGTNSATVSFEIWYKPLDSGATVTAVA